MTDPRLTGKVAIVTIYDDEVVVTADGWKIAKRRVTAVRMLNDWPR